MVTSPAPGTPEYLNIWTGTKKIQEGRIRFKVEKSWITSQGLTNEGVKMYRWNGKDWDPLETDLINTDDTYSYFEAKTYAFSPFSISGPKGVETPTVTPVITSSVTPTASNIPEATEIPEKPLKINLSIILGVVIILLAIAVVLYLKRR